MLFIDEHNYYIYRLFLWKLKQVVAEKPISEAKGESAILQESIIKEVNENVKVDGKLHSTLSSRTSQFLNLSACSELSPQERAILRASLFNSSKLKNLPKELDARIAWPQCSIIGRILDQVTALCLLSSFALKNAKCLFQVL